MRTGSTRIFRASARCAQRSCDGGGLIPTSREHLHALAGFAANASFDGIPVEAIALVKHVLLDSLGCAFAAAGLDASCGFVAKAAGEADGKGESTNFLDGSRACAEAAALVNGALVHALNFDPIGSESGHTGVACVAGPFALAEERDVSGRDLLVAAVVAAEVSARITCVVVEGGRRPAETFLAGQLLSYFGAAAGCGRLVGLDPRRMESALCLALMQMAGSRQVIFGNDPPAKSIYGAFPAQAGVLSARLAKNGLDARCDLFGAPAGLYRAIWGEDFDLGAISRDLGGQYRFMDCEFKPWPASNQVIPFIDAALQMAPDLPELASIDDIVLTGSEHARPWLEPLPQKLAPQNIAAAANSAPYCVAASLAARRFDFDFVDAPARAPHIAAVADRIRVVIAPGHAGATLTLRLRDGAARSLHVDTPPGHPKNPLRKEQHLRKFEQCCALSPNAAVRRGWAEIAAAVLDLENAPSVRDLTRLMR